MKNTNPKAYAADVAGLVVRSLAPTAEGLRGGAVSIDMPRRRTDSAPPP